MPIYGILCIFANWKLYPFCNGSDNELTMRHVFIIILSILPLVSFAQENGNSDLQLMESVKGLMKNSYMEVKWIDDTHFTYCADESEGKIYYINDEIIEQKNYRMSVLDVLTNYILD